MIGTQIAYPYIVSIFLDGRNSTLGYPCPTHIQDSEDDISPPAHIFKSRRRDLHNQEIAYPICRGGYARSFLPQPQRQDLGWIDPDGGLEPDGKGAFEKEQHDRAGDSGSVGDGGFELDLIDQSRLGGHYEGHDGDHGQ